MNQVLLTVSGTISPEIEAEIQQGQRPTADYLAMAEAFQADLLDFPAARQKIGRFGRLLERLGGPKLMLAWTCFRLRHQYQLIFTDGEQIGIPLALLLKFLSPGKRPAHLMIAHLLSVPKKQVFFDWLKVQSCIDIIFVYSTWQKQFIQARWQLPDERVIFLPFMVDDRFFAPDQARPGDPLGLADHGRPVISAVGLEFRDYSTLLQAVNGLDVQVVIAAASPWSKREDSTRAQEIPANVVVRRFSQYDLRDVYAASRFVVMPLYPVDFQAGVTAILEAMAMGKAVICSQTPGQTDVIVAGENGVYVPPQDPDALRTAILSLLADPEEAARLGQNGYRQIHATMNLDAYVQRLASHVKNAIRLRT